jgi:hypothetical protein
MSDLFEVSKGIKIAELVGEDYTFPEMCKWAKMEDPIPPYCGHFDCIKAYYYNKRGREVLQRLNDLMI